MLEDLTQAGHLMCDSTTYSLIVCLSRCVCLFVCLSV